MKKVLAILVAALILVSIPVVLAESDDGVYWLPITMGKIEVSLTDQLGFTPQMSMEVGGSGKYPVLSIYFPGETVQKMLKLQEGQLYIADTDWYGLTGELRTYSAPYRNSMVLFHPTKDSAGITYYINDASALIVKKSAADIVYLQEKDGQFSIPMSYYDEFSDGTIAIDGSEYAQAIYDLTMKQ